MNITLWILQILLSLHTIVGAVWKLSNPAQIIPSLKAIPPLLWRTMSVLEIFLSVGLLLPIFSESFNLFAPISAACIAGEMILFSALHVISKEKPHAPMVYWLVVAGLCVALACGRFAS